MLASETPISLNDSSDIVKCFYSHPLFIQETFFKELILLHKNLQTKAKSIFVSNVFEEDINNFFKTFLTKGRVNDVNQGVTSQIPLTIQKLLSRKGLFIETFCCHSRDAIAVETVPHIERKDDAHLIMRLPRINSKVLEKVASNKIFMQKYVNRMIYCSHPKAQPEQLRNYIPVLNRHDIKSLAVNKSANNYARELATKYSTRYS